MNEHGKSDSSVVPVKPPNKAMAGAIVAEVVEERGLAKGNTDSTTRPGHSAGPDVSNGLDRVREVARQDKDVRFTALLHHVDFNRLWAAYWAIRPEAAPGVDGVTGSRGRTTARTWRIISGVCSHGSTVVPTGRVHLGGCTSRKLTGCNDRSASPRHGG